MSYYDIVAQIRECLERNLTTSEIAHRLYMDIHRVKQIIAREK